MMFVFRRIGYAVSDIFADVGDIIAYFEKGFCDLGVEIPPYSVGNFLKTLVERHCVAVAALLGDRVENVRDRHYSCREGYVFARKSDRIALSVPFFMMKTCYLICNLLSNNSNTISFFLTL